MGSGCIIVSREGRFPPVTTPERIPVPIPTLPDPAAPNGLSRPTRGLKNFNPGNIRFNAHVPWNGQLGEDSKGFVVFDSDFHGLRAIARDLKSMWAAAGGTMSILAAISKYAPPVENNTHAYADYVADMAQMDPLAERPLTADMACHVVAAIVHMENGVQPYPSALIAEAVGAGLA
jgi:hypothetical protein